MDKFAVHNPNGPIAGYLYDGFHVEPEAVDQIWASVPATKGKNPVPKPKFKMNQRPEAKGVWSEPAIPITRALWRSLDLDGYASSSEKKQLRQEIVKPLFPDISGLETQKLDGDKLKEHFDITATQQRVYKKWAARHHVSLPQNMILYAAWLKRIFLGKPIEIKNPDDSKTKYAFEICLIEHEDDFMDVAPAPLTDGDGNDDVRRFNICVPKKYYEKISDTGQFYSSVLQTVLRIVMGMSAKETEKFNQGLSEMFTWRPLSRDKYAHTLIEALRMGESFFSYEDIRVDKLIGDAVHGTRWYVDTFLHAHDLVVDHAGLIETNHHLALSVMKIGEIFNSTQDQGEQIKRLHAVLQSFSHLPFLQYIELNCVVVAIIQRVHYQWCVGKSDDDVARLERMLFAFYGGLLLNQKLHYRVKYSVLRFLDRRILSPKNSRKACSDLIRNLQAAKPAHWKEMLKHIFTMCMVAVVLQSREDDRDIINYDYSLIEPLRLVRTIYAVGMQHYVKHFPEMIESRGIRNLIKILLTQLTAKQAAYNDVMRESMGMYAGMSLRAALKDRRLAQLMLSELGVVFETEDLSFKQYAEAAALVCLANTALGLSPEFDPQAPLKKSFHLLRQKLLQAPHTILESEVVGLCTGGPNESEIVEEFLAPLALCRPELFSVDLVKAIASNYPHEVIKYLFYYLQNQSQTRADVKEVIADYSIGHLPFVLREQAKKIIGEASTIAVIHGVDDGLGDELLRNVMLVEAFLKENPHAQIILWTRRPFLYAHPRVKIFDLGKKFKASLEQLSLHPADVLLYHDSKFHGEDEKIREALKARAILLPPKLYIETNKGGTESSCQQVITRLETEVRRVNYAPTLGLNTWRARNVYETNYRLLAELGLPIVNTRDRSPVESVLTAVAGEKAWARWTELTALKKPGQPTAILNPFGSQAAIKGITIDLSEHGKAQGINDHHLLLAWIKRLIEAGYFVVLTPNGTKWGDRKKALEIEALLEELVPDYRSSFVVAPDLDELPPGSLKYFVSYADFVMTIEGWAMHMAAALGKKFEVVFMPGSGDERWIPFGRLPDQVVSGI